MNLIANAIVLAVVLTFAFAVKSEAQEIDPTGEPQSEIRGVTSCGNWNFGDAALTGLAWFGIALIPIAARRKKPCQRVEMMEWFGRWDQKTCKQLRLTKAEYCDSCR